MLPVGSEPCGCAVNPAKTHTVFLLFSLIFLPSFLSISIVSFCHLRSGTISDHLRSSKSNTSDLVKALPLQCELRAGCSESPECSTLKQSPGFTSGSVGLPEKHCREGLRWKSWSFGED